MSDRNKKDNISCFIGHSSSEGLLDDISSAPGTPEKSHKLSLKRVNLFKKQENQTALQSRLNSGSVCLMSERCTKPAGPAKLWKQNGVFEDLNPDKFRFSNP